jgi:HK97 family phage portal protein
VQSQTQEGWEAVEEDHEWQRLLQKPNQYLDQFSFIEAMISYLLLDGDVWVLQFPFGNIEIPTELYVIPRNTMEAKVNKENNQLEGWKYKPSGTRASMDIELADIAHSFLWNPYNPIFGVSPIEAGRISITTDYKAAMFNQVFFKNNASFGGAVHTEQRLSDKQYDRLKEEIEEHYTGYEQAHKPLLLEQGLKYQQTIPSHKDMLFKDLRGLDKERILQVFGMKKSIISVTDDLNYATSKEQRKSWWQDTNIPLMKLVSSALNFTFFEKRSLRVVFDLSSIEALQEDFKDKVETGERLYKMGFTPNEINERLEFGFDSEDFRDFVFIEGSRVPIGPGVDVLGEEEEEEPILIEPPEEEPEEEEELEEETHLIESNQELLEYKDNFTARGTEVWKYVVRHNAALEEKFRKKTSKMFYEVRVAVLSWLYSQAGKSVKDSENPFDLTRPLTDIDEMSIKPLSALKAEADAIYEATLLTGIETLALELPIGLDIDILAMPEAKKFLKEKLLNLSGISDTMTKKIKKQLINGLERGDDVEKIAAALKDQFAKAARRARTIARTEVYGAGLKKVDIKRCNGSLL